MEFVQSLSRELVDDDAQQKLTNRMMDALSSPLPSRPTITSPNLMEDDTNNGRSVKQLVNRSHPYPSQQHCCDDDDDEYPETPLARKLFPLSHESDSVLVSATTTTTRTRRAKNTPATNLVEEELTSFAMHNNSSQKQSYISNISSSTDPSSLEQSSSASSSSPLRDLIGNEFGLTLLAPLGDEQLWSFERSELYLADESPDRTTKSTSSSSSSSSSSSNDDKRNSSSISMITVTTQEHDSSLEEDQEEEEEEEQQQQQQLVGLGQPQQQHPNNETDNPIVQVLPEPADDLQFCPRILTPYMMQQIHAQLPEALQQNKWDRCFAIGRDGDSFVTLLECCKEYQFTVIVIRTLQGYVLGGFASQPWSGERNNNAGTAKSSSSYYGTGQSFLFASHPDERLPGDAEPVVVAPAAAAAAITATTANNHADTTIPEEESLSFFSWTGSNDYCQICNVDKLFLCMGGEGAFGWIIQDNFERGQSGRCKTYANPPLLPGDACLGGHFEIADFEIYGLQPLFSALTPNTSSRSSRSWLSIRG